MLTCSMFLVRSLAFRLLAPPFFCSASSWRVAVAAFMQRIIRRRRFSEEVKHTSEPSEACIG